MLIISVLTHCVKPPPLGLPGDLLLLGHADSFTLVAGGLGVLTADTQAPIVTKTSVSSDLLQSLQVLTKLVVQNVGHHLLSLAVLDVPGPVEEPVGDLVLARVLHDGDDLLGLLLRELTGALAEGNVGLLQDDVGITSTDTLDGGQRKHNIGFSLNVGVENTKNMLEVRRNNQRHLKTSLVEVNQAILAWS